MAAGQVKTHLSEDGLRTDFDTEDVAVVLFAALAVCDPVIPNKNRVKMRTFY